MTYEKAVELTQSYEVAAQNVTELRVKKDSAEVSGSLPGGSVLLRHL